MIISNCLETFILLKFYSIDINGIIVYNNACTKFEYI